MKQVFNPLSGSFDFVASDLSELSGTLPILQGGTGATTASDARTNLGLVAGGAGDIWVEKAGDVMTGQLMIDGAVDEIQLLVQGNSTQTSDLFVVEKSDGTDYLVVDGDGKVGIGVDPTTALHIKAATGVTGLRIENTDIANFGTILFGATGSTRYVRGNSAELQIGMAFSTFRWFGTGTTVFDLDAADGTTAIKLNARTAHTSGNILEIANAGTAQVSVAFDGSTLIDLTGDSIGLTVQGHSTQTNNLQEWQRSDGTVVGSIDNDGVMFAEAFHVGSSSLSLTAVTAGRLIIDGTNATSIILKRSGTPFMNIASVEQRVTSGYLINWSSNASNPSVAADIGLTRESAGVLRIHNGSTNTALGKLLVGAATIDGFADEIQLTVQGHSTQTSNLMEWQDSDANVLSGVDERGVLFSHANTSVENFFAGDGAGNTTMSGINNVAMGYLALSSLISGANNIAIGTNALNKVTTVSNLVAIGNTALEDNTTGTSNMAIGSNVLEANVDGSENTGIGTNALLRNISGDNNVGIGSSALFANLSDNNTGIGSASLFSNTTGSHNTGIGINALRANISGDDSVGVGRNVLFNNIASDNTAVGSTALFANTSGTRLVAIGFEALKTAQTANDCTAVGYNALLKNTGADSTAVGSRTLDALTSGIRNTAFGRGALGAISTEGFCVAIGFNAGVAATGGSHVFIGNNAGAQVTTETNTLYIANSNTTTPLIYGEFDNDILKFHGSTTIIGQNDVVQQIVTSNSTQTNNLAEWQDSAGNNLFVIEGDGDTYWVGDGVGLPYGSVYGNEIAWAQASAVQNTWYEISDADMTTGQLNEVTHDGNGKLTVLIAGRYNCAWSGAFEANANAVHIQLTFSVNGAETSAGINHFETIGASRQSACSGNAILDLAANDTLEVSIRTTDAGTPDLGADHLNITCVHIGGT